MTHKPFTVTVDNIKIFGRMYLPSRGQPPFPAVCICHGIPARAPDPTDRGYPLLAEKFSREGLLTVIFNFRGTGESGGNLDMSGWTRDLKSVIDYLCTLPQVDKSRLGLMGFSGGAAVSICVAAQDDRIKYVTACACPAEFSSVTRSDNPSSIVEHFRSIGAIRDKDFPPSLEKWLDDFREVSPISYISGIAPRPLLLVQGNEDETVPLSHAYQLYDSAAMPKQLFIIGKAGHRLRLDDRAMDAVIGWLKCRLKLDGAVE